MKNKEPVRKAIFSHKKSIEMERWYLDARTVGEDLGIDFTFIFLLAGRKKYIKFNHQKN